MDNRIFKTDSEEAYLAYHISIFYHTHLHTLSIECIVCTTDYIDKQRILSMEIWSVPMIDWVIVYSCVKTIVVSTFIVSALNCVEHLSALFLGRVLNNT